MCAFSPSGLFKVGQKGIFTIGGTASATIESFELSGAAISSAAGNNGAGIRHQGLNLTVRDCYIHDNQDGVLAAPATANTGAVVIENSELSHNGAGDGYSHNLYIGNYASFTLRFSYSHDGNVGHLFKSRAYVTSVLYSRITDETGGTASYEVDIPNGGTAYVIGNVIEQSATTQNPTILAFGEEGTPAGYDTHLFVVNNTFVNDKGSGTFVADATSTPALVENNVFYKAGTISGQAGATLTTNFDATGGADPKFTNAAAYDFTLLAGSPCIDKGTAPGSNAGQSLAPAFEYVHPLGEVARSVVGPAIDVGAYEYGIAEDAGVIGPDASPADGGTSSGSGSSSGGKDAGGSSSSSGGSGSGGSSSGSGSGSGGSSGGDGGASGASGGGSGGGCGCVLAGSSDRWSLEVAGLGALTWMLARRRRTRPRA